MTEKDKMLAGLIYDANYDKELLAERARAKDLPMIITICAHRTTRHSRL
jgi:membrane-bound metal-dependent hydrolase YbcI (DUF457 family)